MANVTEFDHSPTSPSSPIYTGYEIQIPALQSPVKPEHIFVIGANGDATLGTNGRLIITQGISNTPGTFYRTSSYRWDRIHNGSFRRTLPTTDTAKVVTIQLTAPDYTYSNPNGIAEIYLDYFDKRYTTPVRENYVIESPASAGRTLGQRAKELVAKINATSSSLVTASSPASGTDQAQGVITLTAKKVAQNIKFTAGQGTDGTVTVTTAAATEFGTSKFIADQGYETADSNKTGKTFVTVDFKVDRAVPAPPNGTFSGRSVGNNAFVLEEVLVRLMFEVGAGDAKFTAFNTLIQGKATPASSYYAKAGDLTA